MSMHKKNPESHKEKQRSVPHELRLQGSIQGESHRTEKGPHENTGRRKTNVSKRLFEKKTRRGEIYLWEMGGKKKKMLDTAKGNPIEGGLRGRRGELQRGSRGGGGSNSGGAFVPDHW